MSRHPSLRQARLALPVGLLAALLAAPAAPASARTLSFAEALQLALSSSPRLRESEAQAAAAAGAQTSAHGAGLPQLRVSGTGTRSDNPMTVFADRLSQGNATFADFGASQFTGPSSLGVAPNALDEPGYNNNLNTKVEVSVPLYTGGRVTAQVERAERLVAAARMGDAWARQTLTYEVLAAFEGLRTARARLQVADASEKAAAAVLDTAKHMVQQGAALRSDRLTAQVNFDQARLRQQAAEDAAADWVERLRVLTGLPADEPIELGPPASPPMATGDAEELLERALADNPELRALQHQVDASGAGVDAARSAYKPSFNLVLQHEWNDPHLGFSGPSDTIAGVMSWDVFDFGVRSGEVSRARAEQDAARARLAQARDALRLRIGQARRSAQLAATRVSVSKVSVEDAAEAQRILRLRYAQGAATLSDTLAGQARLDEARDALLNAQYQERLARAALLQAVGELDLQHVSASAQDGELKP
jgi:outer membrane protein